MTARPRSAVTSWTVIDRHYRGVATVATALQKHATGFRSGMHLLLGLVVSGLSLYFALHGVNLVQVWRELQLARPVPLMLAIGIAIAGNLFRALRWRVILGGQAKVPLRVFFSSMMISYLANNLLPVRLGELVRIYALERKAGISKSTSAATVILERTTDTLVLLALVIGTSYFLPLPPSIRSASRAGLAVFAAFATFLISLAIRGKNLVGWAIRNLNSLRFCAGHKLPRILETFIHGLGVFRRGKDALVTFALTLVIWGIEAVSVALVMMSLGLSLPWIASLLLVVVLSLSSIIPAAPGAVGTYEFFAVTALTPFAVQSTQSMGLALALHGITYVTSTALGFGCLWAESLSLGELLIKAPKEA